MDISNNAAIVVSLFWPNIEKANLLGYKTHADYILDDRIAKKPENVYDLLNQIMPPAVEMAKKEAQEFQSIINKEGDNFKLMPWDWWYYAEKVRAEKYDLDEETLRPYFKLDNVRDGAFEVANKLWGITFKEKNDIPIYHEDVEVFEVKDTDGSHIGILYMDFFPRKSKRVGAWMNTYRKQYMVKDEYFSPVVTTNFNFSKPTADKPALLSFEEVETLYHEFGHALHGLLSNCKYRALSGTEVKRDFVELPSQIMENWANEPEVLKLYAKHYETDEVIPEELINKIQNSRLFNQGFVTVEYVSACFLDMDWHTLENADNINVIEFENKSLENANLIPEIVVRYRSTYFAHIFDYDYSAGYYSYIWAEVLDADAFDTFKQKGLFDQESAKSFRDNILSKGGTEDPMELFVRFKGKEPSVEPLLKNRGLI
ncbi:M3 family metallopeptidase [Bacteroidota bacterium]